MVSVEAIVGCSMIAFSGLCLLVNMLVLSVIAMSPEFMINSSYKIMLLLGVYDVIQLTVHIVSGIFTALQYQSTYWIAKILGVIISPCYECYVFVTILLAINRFVLLCCPPFEKIIFSSKGIRMWAAVSVIIFAIFALLLSSNQANYRYYVTEFKWSYDYNFPYSRLLQAFSMYYQIIGIFVAWGFYIAITVSIVRYRKEVDLRRHYRANRKILFQTFVLTVYCTIQNFCWHRGDEVMPASFGRLKNFLINTMWIGNAGMNSFICIIINKQLRQKLLHVVFSWIRCCFRISAALFLKKVTVHNRILRMKQVNTTVPRKPWTVR